MEFQARIKIGGEHVDNISNEPIRFVVQPTPAVSAVTGDNSSKNLGTPTASVSQIVAATKKQEGNMFPQSQR